MRAWLLWSEPQDLPQWTQVVSGYIAMIGKPIYPPVNQHRCGQTHHLLIIFLRKPRVFPATGTTVGV